MPDDSPELDPQETLTLIETKNAARKFVKRVVIGAVVGASVGFAVGLGVDLNRRINVLAATQRAILEVLQDEGIIQNLRFGK